MHCNWPSLTNYPRPLCLNKGASTRWCRSVQADIQAFRSRERPPKKAAPVDCSQHHADSVPDFLNGRVLRDYQTVSLHWMMENFRKKRSCILGDEMVCLPQLGRLKCA